MRVAGSLIARAALVAGCASMTAPGPSAVATLAPTKGNATAGTVRFAQKGDKVAVAARVACGVIRKA